MYPAQWAAATAGVDRRDPPLESNPRSLDGDVLGFRGRLCHPVPNRRDPERPLTTVRLGNHHTPYCLGRKTYTGGKQPESGDPAG